MSNVFPTVRDPTLLSKALGTHCSQFDGTLGRDIPRCSGGVDLLEEFFKIFHMSFPWQADDETCSQKTKEKHIHLRKIAFVVQNTV